MLFDISQVSPLQWGAVAVIGLLVRPLIFRIRQFDDRHTIEEITHDKAGILHHPVLSELFQTEPFSGAKCGSVYELLGFMAS